MYQIGPLLLTSLDYFVDSSKKVRNLAVSKVKCISINADIETDCLIIKVRSVLVRGAHHRPIRMSSDAFEYELQQ